MKTLYLIFTSLLFTTASFAQKHETLKLNRDSYLTIYNVYDTLDSIERGDTLYRRWQTDTLFIELVSTYDQEIQGKTIKIKTKEADSVSVEQAYQVTYNRRVEEHKIITYKPYTYNDDYQILKSLSKQKNKFKIVSYSEKIEKIIPYKQTTLSLKNIKTYLIGMRKKELNTTYYDDHKKYIEEDITYIKTAISLDELMDYELSYIYLRITFFKNGKKIKQQIVAFEYYYGC